MAEQELEVTFTWENNIKLEVIGIENGGTPFTIIHLDENNHFVDTFPAVKEVIEIYFKSIMNKILVDMKAP